MGALCRARDGRDGGRWKIQEINREVKRDGKREHEKMDVGVIYWPCFN